MPGSDKALITNDNKYLLFKLRMLFLSDMIYKIGRVDIEAHTISYIEYKDGECHCVDYGILDNERFVAACYCYEGEEHGSFDTLESRR